MTGPGTSRPTDGAAVQSISSTASDAKDASAALIALDWGTTALRAYLIDAAGNVMTTRASPAGIMNLPRPADQGGFDAAFDDVCGEWLDADAGLPVIAAGMVGSAQGWAEAPYVETPASPDALIAGIVRVQTARGVTLHIVPGVLERGALPNVMRGEETQIFGALSSDDASSDDARHEARHEATLIGLPGTHAKWVVVEGGRIDRFHTFMTGEVFAALRDHTILGRTMRTPDEPDLDAFVRGVDTAKQQGAAGVLATIFSARTLGLTGQLSAEQQPDYLSGLLIGHELGGLDALLAQQGSTLAGKTLRLIGNDALCERYRLALTRFDCTDAQPVRQAAEHGLWRIAVEAGLTQSASPARSTAGAAR